MKECTKHPFGKLPEGKGLWEVAHGGCDYPDGGCDCYCGINCKPRASAPAPLDKSSCEFCDDKGVVLDKETGLVVDCPECDNPDTEREVFLSSVPMPFHLNAEQLRGIRSKIAEGEAGMYEAALLLQHLDSIPAEFYRVKWNEEQLQGLMEQTKRANALLDVEKVAREIDKYYQVFEETPGGMRIAEVAAILRKHLPSLKGRSERKMYYWDIFLLTDNAPIGHNCGMEVVMDDGGFARRETTSVWGFKPDPDFYRRCSRCNEYECICGDPVLEEHMADIVHEEERSF